MIFANWEFYISWNMVRTQALRVRPARGNRLASGGSGPFGLPQRSVAVTFEQ